MFGENSRNSIWYFRLSAFYASDYNPAGRGTRGRANLTELFWAWRNVYSRGCFFQVILLFTVVPLSISKSCYRQVFSTEDIDKAIVYVSRSGKIENTHSLRKLARMGFESYISKEYKAGKITLREASVLLNLTLSETMDVLSDMGVKGNIHAKDVLNSLKTFSS